MKFSSILLPITLIGAASAACVDGEIKEIVPGYKVKITCDSRVKGTLKSGIATQEACAQLCKDADAPHCSYKASSKQCLVATTDGVPQAAVGAVLMSKFDDEDGDDFSEPTAEEKLAECQAELAALKEAQWKCPENHEKDIPLGDNIFRLYCEKAHTDADEHLLRNVDGIDTTKKCAEECLKDSACTFALKSITENKCKLMKMKYSYTGKPGGKQNTYYTIIKHKQ